MHYACYYYYIPIKIECPWEACKIAGRCPRYQFQQSHCQKLKRPCSELVETLRDAHSVSPVPMLKPMS